MKYFLYRLTEFTSYPQLWVQRLLTGSNREKTKHEVLRKMLHSTVDTRKNFIIVYLSCPAEVNTLVKKTKYISKTIRPRKVVVTLDGWDLALSEIILQTFPLSDAFCLTDFVTHKGWNKLLLYKATIISKYV